ncbi:SMI1/KNR4 family protein [Streptomyces piniterrae]|uniref:SMI1/KNR4 family protein n=1 Tax=Streptomyces piniterrae TaxID=2571125 RepID=A0A4U0NVT1_9ACTN|nr:SMI1/KNR4 family protein [Streptomyces piniterrae]TJZ58866.1 SMI1/KNR4 family protein [Streptomyces piniterrae]
MNSSLARLVRLIPPPSAPREKDWESVEQALRAELPSDYKELTQAYGGSHWDGYLYLLEPGCCNDNYDLIEWAEQQTEALEGLWEFERKPTELAERGSRVVPWATTDNGECLYWLVRPGEAADQWTVMVNEARGDRWEHFPVTCTEFLVSVLTGELRSGILSSLFPLAVHEFRRLAPM